MNGPSIQVAFDCADPDGLAKFWAAVLGYTLQPPPEGFASWDDWCRANGIPEEKWNDTSAIVDPEGARPRIFFQRVPESKSVKNRVHLDVNVGGERGTPPVERRRKVEEALPWLTSLGARVLYSKEENDEFWYTFADPEGNEFCIQ